MAFYSRSVKDISGAGFRGFRAFTGSFSRVRTSWAGQNRGGGGGLFPFCLGMGSIKG